MKKLTELSLKQHAAIHTATLWVALAVIALGGWSSEQGSLNVVAWLGIAILGISLLWRFLFIKCPHCGSGLYNARELPEYCPDCGKKLT